MSEVEVYSVNKLTFWAMDKNVVGKKIRGRDTTVMTQEQVGNVRESRSVRKMAASTCSVVSGPAAIPPGRQKKKNHL